MANDEYRTPQQAARDAGLAARHETRVERAIRRAVAEEIAAAIELKRDQRSYHETVGEWSEVSHGGVLLGLKEAAQIAREFIPREPA